MMLMMITKRITWFQNENQFVLTAMSNTKCYTLFHWSCPRSRSDRPGLKQ